MGVFFPNPYGEIEVTAYYADNQMYCQEVRFSVPVEAWSEFEGSELYRELKQYLSEMQKKIPDSNRLPHELPAQEESLLCKQQGAKKRFPSVFCGRWRKKRH